MTFVKYRTFNNKFTALIKQLKINYFSERFMKYSRNTKRTWDTVNDLVGCRRSGSVEGIMYQGSLCKDDQTKAEVFNNFFSNIAHDLVIPLNNQTGDPLSYLNQRSRLEMVFSSASTDEVGKTIVSLKNKKSNTVDIPVLIYKNLSPVLSPLISNLFNSSVESGCFPNVLKIAKVIPLHKGGDKLSIGNYRPISLLPTLSKIFEKLMFTRIYNFLSQANFFISTSMVF